MRANGGGSAGIYGSLDAQVRPKTMFDGTRSFSLTNRGQRAALALPAAKTRSGDPQPNLRHLAILFWIYVAQALAGSLIGFTAPFLYFFGVL
jgi:hypothetical protein